MEASSTLSKIEQETKTRTDPLWDQIDAELRQELDEFLKDHWDQASRVAQWTDDVLADSMPIKEATKMVNWGVITLQPNDTFALTDKAKRAKNLINKSREPQVPAILSIIADVSVKEYGPMARTFDHVAAYVKDGKARVIVQQQAHSLMPEKRAGV